MHRLAWFTPTPPDRSGIAAYSEELLPLLSSAYAIDVFTTPRVADRRRPDGHPPVFEGHDFAWKHFTSPYDLIVYQLGNATCHAFMWPHLFRHPGLVVLHDAQLHHSRAWDLLRRGRVDDYRAEFVANHPDAPAGLADLVVQDLAGCLYYFWPMVRLVAQSSRLLAVHSQRLAADLRQEYDVDVERIRMGVTDPLDASSERRAQRRRTLRERYGIPADAVVFAAFGLVTPEKRIPLILQVMTEVVRVAPTARLLLVGGRVDHYDALSEASALGLSGHVIVTGYVPDDQLADHLAAADVSLNLRWPTCRETSASWLRALAAGLPTVVTDLADHDETATYDATTWAVQRPAPVATGNTPNPEPACVSVDLVHERHALALALSHLARFADRRSQLGMAARNHWACDHTLACMAEDYRRVIDRALARPVVWRRDLPAHLRTEGLGTARRIASRMGVEIDIVTGSDRAVPDCPGPSV
jgi:glycosyltransferase involved in cell wall biosynthesis